MVGVARELSVIIGWPVRGRGVARGLPASEWEAGGARDSIYYY